MPQSIQSTEKEHRMYVFNGHNSHTVCASILARYVCMHRYLADCIGPCIYTVIAVVLFHTKDIVFMCQPEVKGSWTNCLSVGKLSENTYACTCK